MESWTFKFIFWYLYVNFLNIYHSCQPLILSYHISAYFLRAIVMPKGLVYNVIIDNS